MLCRRSARFSRNVAPRALRSVGRRSSSPPSQATLRLQRPVPTTRRRGRLRRRRRHRRAMDSIGYSASPTPSRPVPISPFLRASRASIVLERDTAKSLAEARFRSARIGLRATTDSRTISGLSARADCSRATAPSADARSVTLAIARSSDRLLARLRRHVEFTQPLTVKRASANAPEGTRTGMTSCIVRAQNITMRL